VNDPLQGDVWWADLPPPVGRRPVLILTRSPAVSRLANVTIAPLTRNIRHIESEAIISPDDGVPDLSAANLDNILTIPKRRLDRRITRISPQTLEDVKRAIRYALALD